MFSYASEICIEKAPSFQGSDFDANILNSEKAGSLFAAEFCDR
jgi:hypothetical protein